MAKIKTTAADRAGAPTGTYRYFLLKPDGTVLASFGAGPSPWTASSPPAGPRLARRR